MSHSQFKSIFQISDFKGSLHNFLSYSHSTHPDNLLFFLNQTHFHLFCVQRYEYLVVSLWCKDNPRASQVVLVVKNLPANAGDIRDVGLIPGSGRSPRGGHGSALQYPCLENPMDRGACRATVCRVSNSWTRLKQLNHACTQR